MIGVIVAEELALSHTARAVELTLSLPFHSLHPMQPTQNTASAHRLFWLQITWQSLAATTTEGPSHHETIMQLAAAGKGLCDCL